VGTHVWYEALARPVLFRIGPDAEAAHDWTLKRLTALSGRPRTLRILSRLLAVSAPTDVFGLRFANPVGLAAGLDKDGTALSAWPALGFGFVEVGTVTWHSQPGNAAPRLFRLPRSGAIVNRMGLNNAGAAALAARLAGLGRLPVPLGISLGKSAHTPLERSIEDYLASLGALYSYGDYFAVNVSSPNTPGLRSLQDRAYLDELLGALLARAADLADGAAPKPLLVKIAPDLTDRAIDDVLQVCVDRGAAGLIATNTTLGRPGVHPAEAAAASQSGGLSGRPLAARSRAVVAHVHRHTGGRLPIIGVGGVMRAEDALGLIDAGASLVQLCTGLVYHGPGLVRRVALALRGRSR
jgi:dihydroorotate dehydrogenase